MLCNSRSMGIMNRYMRGERNNPMLRGANRAKNYGNMPMTTTNNGNGNDGRFSHYGRNDSQGGQRDHGSSRRSRDSDRDHYRRRRRSRSRSRSYDSRSRSRSPEYRRRRSRSNSREGYRSRRRDRDSRSHTSHHGSTNASMQPKAFGAQPVMGLPPPPPPPPPRPGMVQPMAMGQQPPQQLLPGQPPQMMIPGQPPQQQFVQSLGQIPQQQIPNPQMQQLLQQQQLQQLQQRMPGLQPAQLQQLLMNPMMAQQLQAGKQMMPGQVPNLGLPQGIQQMNAQTFPAPGQNPGQPPVDIMGLANKAAEALSGIPQGVPQMANPNFPPPPASAQPYQPQGMASEKDLPMMVQYAVQNLRTTGHIGQTLDAPLVNMLKRLPESTALQALEIFSSCDTSKMRNKSACLSGILKKGLVKLGL